MYQKFRKIMAISAFSFVLFAVGCGSPEEAPAAEVPATPPATEMSPTDTLQPPDSTATVRPDPIQTSAE